MHVDAVVVVAGRAGGLGEHGLGEDHPGAEGDGAVTSALLERNGDHPASLDPSEMGGTKHLLVFWLVGRIDAG